jgi:lipopolysaccharide assembly outer membrane protein LptD (OstA)
MLIMKHPTIQEAWNKRSALFAEGYKLFAKGYKLHDESNKLYAEGDILYSDAVIAAHGPKSIIDWGTGEIEVEE